MRYSIDRMFDVSEQVAIVVGATGGMGSEISLALKELGVKLVIVGRRPERLEELQGKLCSKGGEVAAVSADVTDKASVQKMAHAAMERFGRIDILVNCAAVSHLGTAVDFDERLWDQMLGVNLKGTFLTCQAVGRYILRSATVGS